MAFLLCATGIALVLGNPPARADDTDGPGAPGDDWSAVPLNAYGPCNDPQTWTQTGGVGNAACGLCGNKTFARSTGKCKAALKKFAFQGGGGGGKEAAPNFDCRNGKCAASCTYFFASTPVGGFEFTGCLVATAALLVADGVCFAACGGACITLGVWTGGAACWACLAGCGAAGVAIVCFYDECVENCNYTGFAFAGTIPCCDQ